MENLSKSRFLDLTIAEASKELRLPTDLKGCGMFLHLLEAVVENQNAVYNIGILYDEAAQLFEVKKESVAVIIRYALIKSWDEIDPEVAVKIFGRYDEKDCPSNKKYLAAVSNYIRLKINK